MSGKHSTGGRPGNRRRRARGRSHRTGLVAVVVVGLVGATGVGLALVSGLFGGESKSLASESTPTCLTTTRMTIAAAPAITSATQAVAPSLAVPDAAGLCLDLQVREAAAADVVADIAAGLELPSVWIPDSPLWLSLARAKARNVRLPETAPALASSPVVLAGRKEQFGGALAEAQINQWETLLSGKSPGPTEITLPDPSRSTAGLLALTQLPGALVEGAPGAGARTMAGATRTVALAEDDRSARSAVLREDALLAPVLEADVSGAGGFGTVSEIAYRPLGKVPPADFRLVLVDESVRAGYDRLLAALTSTEAQALYQQDGLQPALAQGMDITPERAQNMLQTWQVAGRRAKLLAVLDVSGSMGELVPGTKQTRLQFAAAASRTALLNFAPDSELGIWAFATGLDGPRDHVEVLPSAKMSAPLPGGLTHRDRALAVLEGSQPRPDAAGTGLYDTTLAAMAAARRHYASGRLNVAVIMTDGENEDPTSISLGTLTAALERQSTDEDRPVRLVMIGLGPDVDTNVLRRIASAGGGRAFVADDLRDMNRIVLQALTSLG